jgi:ParB family chromosome partitioning protein
MYAGFDVSDKTTHICVVDAAGGILRRDVVASDPDALGRYLERLNVTPSWLSRYLGSARLPDELVAAFAGPHDFRIKHVTQIKPLLKPLLIFMLVTRMAGEIVKAKSSGKPMAAADVIKQLSAAAKCPQKVRKAGHNAGSHETMMDSGGKPILTINKPKRGEGVSITLIQDGDGNRVEVIAAFQKLLDTHWPVT